MAIKGGRVPRYTKFSQDFYSDEVVVCPYCKHEHDPGYSEGELYDETTDEWECEECGKLFVVNVYVDFSWTTRKPMEGRNDRLPY